ncbi:MULTISPECIES: hypothetical protein [unclassified Paracoccus (in: a-proteobacteria)]|uniref:hypothetical protein n=1 Tax=unclassified Paracoccus (in: a-proteobacteria) TaxID=2688777 RepID=UPI0012B3B830|nr:MULTISPECIES: hypothetical protein [unclassified Paracoccus (in: a-proteobacteria)]UXU74889.1 hypothetical protein GB879_013520 [Paracoccus sp. SMMA_5]UXU80790.1 hypothetical protein GB880_013515 [Paracoccus sp. SMMA_5_TC]
MLRLGSVLILILLIAQPATLGQAGSHGSADPDTAAIAAPLRIGERLDAQRLHKVTRPGLYGMSHPPPGSRYGIIDGRLIRYDPESETVLSIIRQIDRILD